MTTASGGPGKGAAPPPFPDGVERAESLRVQPSATTTPVTCSGQAVRARVRTLLADNMALVDTGPTVEEVSVASPWWRPPEGDTLLVHAKEAIARVTEVPDDHLG